MAALETISKLPEQALVELPPEVAAMLEDGDNDVRRAALRTICKLPEQAQVELAPKIVAILDRYVRQAALGTINMLPEHLSASRAATKDSGHAGGQETSCSSSCTGNYEQAA